MKNTSLLGGIVGLFACILSAHADYTEPATVAVPIPNFSFEYRDDGQAITGTTSLAVEAVPPAVQTWASTDAQAWTTNTSVQIEQIPGTTSNATGSWAASLNSGNGRIDTVLPTQYAAGTYTLTMMARGAANAKSRLHLMAGGSFVGYATGTNFDSNEFRPVSYIATIPAGSNFIGQPIHIRINQMTSGAWAQVDNVQLTYQPPASIPTTITVANPSFEQDGAQTGFTNVQGWTRPAFDSEAMVLKPTPSSDIPAGNGSWALSLCHGEHVENQLTDTFAADGSSYILSVYARHSKQGGAAEDTSTSFRLTLQRPDGQVLAAGKFSVDGTFVQKQIEVTVPPGSDFAGEPIVIRIDHLSEGTLWAQIDNVSLTHGGTAVTVPNNSFESLANGNPVTSKQNDLSNVMAWAQGVPLPGSDQGVESSSAQGVDQSYAAYLNGNAVQQELETEYGYAKYTLTVGVRKTGSGDGKVRLSLLNSSGEEWASREIDVTDSSFTDQSLVTTVMGINAGKGLGIVVQVAETSGNKIEIDNVRLTSADEQLIHRTYDSDSGIYAGWYTTGSQVEQDALRTESANITPENPYGKVHAYVKGGQMKLEWKDLVDSNLTTVTSDGTVTPSWKFDTGFEAKLENFEEDYGGAFKTTIEIDTHYHPAFLSKLVGYNTLWAADDGEIKDINDKIPQFWDWHYLAEYTRVLEKFRDEINALDPAVRACILGIRENYDAVSTEHTQMKGQYAQIVNADGSLRNGWEPASVTNWLDTRTFENSFKADYELGVHEVHYDLYNAINSGSSPRIHMFMRDIDGVENDVESGMLGAFQTNGGTQPDDFGETMYYLLQQYARSGRNFLFTEGSSNPMISLYWTTLNDLNQGTAFQMIGADIIRKYDGGSKDSNGFRAICEFAADYLGYQADPEHAPGGWVALRDGDHARGDYTFLMWQTDTIDPEKCDFIPNLSKERGTPLPVAGTPSIAFTNLLSETVTKQWVGLPGPRFAQWARQLGQTSPSMFFQIDPTLRNALNQNHGVDGNGDPLPDAQCTIHVIYLVPMDPNDPNGSNANYEANFSKAGAGNTFSVEYDNGGKIAAKSITINGDPSNQNQDADISYTYLGSGSGDADVNGVDDGFPYGWWEANITVKNPNFTGTAADAEGIPFDVKIGLGQCERVTVHRISVTKSKEGEPANSAY